jgi:hypothetical protein
VAPTLVEDCSAGPRVLHPTDTDLSAGGIDLELWLAVTTGRGSRIRCKAETVEDRAKRQDCHEQYSEMKIAELR